MCSGSEAGSNLRLYGKDGSHPQHGAKELALVSTSSLPGMIDHFTEMWCGTEAGSCLRRIDSCITQRKAQEPSRTCNESKEEEEEVSTANARAPPMDTNRNVAVR